MSIVVVLVTLWTLHLHACQVRVAVGNSCLCCCTCEFMYLGFTRMPGESCCRRLGSRSLRLGEVF